MPSKSTKRIRRATGKHTSPPTPKDDGSRWIVVRHGEPVYGYSAGCTKLEAERLAEGLLAPAEIICVSLS